MNFFRRIFQRIMGRRKPLKQEQWGGKVDRRQRRMQKAEWRRTRKKLAKQVERFQPKHPTPTKAQPSPVMMQKRELRDHVKLLQAINHQLAGKIAEMKKST